MPGKKLPRPAHTYSIVAFDQKAGQIGVAVQSHWFSVGSDVSWAEAGAGAVATQSMVNVSFGPRGLALMKEGKTAKQAVQELIAADENRELRQLAAVDAGGKVAAYTGKKCIPAAGHYIGEGYSVQANLMLSDRVWPAMADAFEKSRGPLAERMVKTLEAAQNAGGDLRGKQSAALLIVRHLPTGRIWEDRVLDLHVEDHPEPVREIGRLLKVFRAYEHMNRGDLAIEHNDTKRALQEYRQAQSICPENLEMKYWYAVSLANAGKLKSARSIFKDLFSRDERWLIFLKRLDEAGLLEIDKKELERILSQESA